MPIISERDQEALRLRFAESLASDVSITLFTEGLARSLLTIPGQPSNPMAQTARSLAQDLAALSPRLKLRILDIHGDGAEAAQALGVDRIPAYLLGDDPEGRIRFYGAPIGNEFPTLIEVIEGLARQNGHPPSPLADAAQKLIGQPVRLQVFVTPT